MWCRLVPKKLHRFNHSWIEPDGYNTGIKVYNCVDKQKVALKVPNKNALTWYTCGPTVYDSSHIGHASCYVKMNIIQRILKNYFGINIISVMNITDIDDKIITRSESLKIPWKELTNRFEKEFWTDMNQLGVTKPDLVLRVTENIPLIVGFISKLIESKQAYLASDKSVYFDLSRFPYYGKLGRIVEEADRTSEIKRNANDFALWKAAKPGEPFWDSPWGGGRPGWHIECSTLATHIFGSTIDVHAGGIDLRFPHHENEEAQSCAFHNTRQWVNYWLHMGHLHLKDDEKMSKSLKNTVSIGEMLKGTSAEAFRMACVMSHYRHNLEWSQEYMKTAENTLKNYRNFVSNCGQFLVSPQKAAINVDVLSRMINETRENVDSALRDDFNTALVLKHVNELIASTNSMLHSCTTDSQNDERNCYHILMVLKLVNNIMQVFGVDLEKKCVTGAGADFNEIMEILCGFRQGVRAVGIGDKNKDLLNLCDILRDDLRRIGVNIKDLGKQSSWSR